MTKYAQGKYNTFKYGVAAKLAYSVEPFIATAIDYSRVDLEWAAPTGDINGIRLVRNQNGFPETAEDGVILWDWVKVLNSLDEDISAAKIYSYSDTDINSTIPLVPGKHVFYRMWIRKASDFSYVLAGEVSLVLPRIHADQAYGDAQRTGTQLLSSHDKFMDLLPRVYTSGSGAPIDEVDGSSTLSNFLKPFSFTVDEFLTLADLVLPDEAGVANNPSLLALQSKQYNLPAESSLPIKNQKKLIRDAIYLYQTKGTKTCIETLTEDVTGFAPTITMSPNLMLTNQDSTFYRGVGSWTPQGDCTIVVDNSVIPPTAELSSADRYYCAKVTVGTEGAKLDNGSNRPVTLGIPVTAETVYTFSLYAKSTASSATILPKITWYDFKGGVISSDTYVALGTTSTWSRLSFDDVTAPLLAEYATLNLEFGPAGDYWLDLLQFAPSTATEFQDARGVSIFLNPAKVNYVTNPSFEGGVGSDTSMWQILAASHTFADNSSLPGLFDATNSLEIVTNTGTNSFVTYTSPLGLCPTGKIYTYSIYVYLESTTVTDTENMYLLLEAVDSGQSLASVNVIDFTATTSWQRIQVTLDVPENFNQADTQLYASLGCSNGTGKQIDIDAAQLETNYSATDYFDGNMGSALDCFWAGTVNASISYYYPGKDQKISRLINELITFLPGNTPFLIQSYAIPSASNYIETYGITM